MPDVISLLNFKGGTGKSSATQNLADILARRGMKILVIDGDRQSNTTATFLGQRVKPSLTDVICEKATFAEAIHQARENISIIGSDTDLDHAIIHLKEYHRAWSIIPNGIKKLQGIDLVLIDQAGAYTSVMEALLRSSNKVLIPCELEPYSVQGIFDMFTKLQTELPDHELDNGGIIPYAVDMRPKMTRIYLDQLKEAFGLLVLPSIRTDQTVPNAQSVQKTVMEYDPRCPAAQDFATLATHLFAPASVSLEVQS
ncbi:MAG: ParA family protein [Ktedonobacteraceae bacterium]